MYLRTGFWILIASMVILSCSKENDRATQPNIDPSGQPDPQEGEGKSSEKQILSFRFPEINTNGVMVQIAGKINHDAKIITTRVPAGTDITSITPVVDISAKAVYEPKGPQNFSKPINFTVTAEDGTSLTYLVTTEIALTQKEVLLKFLEANPESGLNKHWTEDKQLADWKGVTVNEEGQVIKLSLHEHELAVIPPEIGFLTNLKELIISRNRDKLTYLPPEIGNLINLEKLDLNFNALHSLPQEIGKLKSLEILSVLDNGNLESIPNEIGELQELKKLILGGNLLKSLPPEISKLKNLKTLYLSNNAIESLQEEIIELSQLEELYLSRNKLISLPVNISKLELLRELSLNFNGLRTLPPELGQLRYLEKLDLDFNYLEALPEELNELSALESMLVTYNELTFIPKTLSDLKNLKKLSLAHNNITSLPKEICDMDDTNGGITNIDIVPGVICIYSP